MVFLLRPSSKGAIHTLFADGTPRNVESATGLNDLRYNNLASRRDKMYEQILKASKTQIMNLFTTKDLSLFQQPKREKQTLKLQTKKTLSYAGQQCIMIETKKSLINILNYNILKEHGTLISGHIRNCSNQAPTNNNNILKLDSVLLQDPKCKVTSRL